MFGKPCFTLHTHTHTHTLMGCDSAGTWLYIMSCRSEHEPRLVGTPHTFDCSRHMTSSHFNLLNNKFWEGSSLRRIFNHKCKSRRWRRGASARLCGQVLQLLQVDFDLPAGLQSLWFTRVFVCRPASFIQKSHLMCSCVKTRHSEAVSVLQNMKCDANVFVQSHFIQTLLTGQFLKCTRSDKACWTQVCHGETLVTWRCCSTALCF